MEKPEQLPTFTMHDPGQLSTFVERLSNLPADLQKQILERGELTPLPMETKTYYMSDGGDWGSKKSTVFTLKPTTYMNKSSVTTVIGNNRVLASYRGYKISPVNETSCSISLGKTTDSQLCDASDKCAVIALSHRSDDEHTLFVLRSKLFDGAVTNNRMQKKGYNILSDQAGTVTALALHKLAGSETHRCAYTVQRGNRLQKWLFEDHTLNRMRFFDIDKNETRLIRSAPTPCIFKELFPLSNTRPCYLGLDIEGNVWTIHEGNDGLMSYSKKITNSPVSHIAVNNEHTTASGFHPLIILLMGNRLMAADLALKPKTILFHIATLPDDTDVMRLELCNAYYGVRCKKWWTEPVKEFLSFDRSWSGKHPNHSWHPYLTSYENISHHYLAASNNVPIVALEKTEKPHRVNPCFAESFLLY
jgi:hypothetical protein